MVNLLGILNDLQNERGRVQQELERLEKAISVVEGLTERNHVGRGAGTRRMTRIHRPGRKMSAAGRRRIAAAQRARWARLKVKRQQSQTRKAPRTMSAAARNRMAAAQQARWAKLKAGRKQKMFARPAKKPAQKVQATAA